MGDRGGSGDRKETSVKSCGQRIQGVVEDKWGTSGTHLQNHAGQIIQSVLGDKWKTSGDKWETNVKSCGQGIQNVLAEKEARRRR